MLQNLSTGYVSLALWPNINYSPGYYFRTDLKQETSLEGKTSTLRVPHVPYVISSSHVILAKTFGYLWVLNGTLI